MHLLQQLNAPVTVLQKVLWESFQYSLLQNCLQTGQSMVVRAPARARTLARQPWSCELSLLLGKMTSFTHFETMHQEAHALTCNKNARQTFCMPAQHWFVTNDHDLEARWCQLTLKPHTWPLHCLTIIKSVLQIVLPMRAALQVTKRVAADVSWADILHNNCRHKNKKRQEQLASHAGCQLNAGVQKKWCAQHHTKVPRAISLKIYHS